MEFKLKTIGKNKVLRRPKAKEINLEDKEKIVNEELELFRDAKERLGLDIDLKHVEERLRSIKLLINDNQKGSSGYYNHIKDEIGFDSFYLQKNNNETKRTMFHEFIHGMTQKQICLYNILHMDGLMEGETESLVEDVLGDQNRSSYCNVGIPGISVYLQANFSPKVTRSYFTHVSIVRQMEYLLGKKSYDSILNGNMQFEKDFAQKYGKSLLRYLAKGTTELKFFRREKIIDEFKKFSNMQNVLLKKAFDRDFSEVKDIESAQKFFQKLRGFETERCRFAVSDGNVSEDLSFQNYYYSKYEETIKNLSKLGIDKNEIQEGLKEYKYKKQKFKSYRSEEELQEDFKTQIKNFSYQKYKEENVVVNNDDYDFRCYEILPNSGFLVCIQKKESGLGIYTPVSYFKPDIHKLEALQKYLNTTNGQSENSKEQDMRKIIEFFEQNGFAPKDIHIEDKEIKDYIFQEDKKVKKENEIEELRKSLYGENDDKRQKLIGLIEKSKKQDIEIEQLESKIKGNGVELGDE